MASHRRLIAGLAPLLLILPLLWVLLPGGLPNTADGRVHFVRAAEMVHAWNHGLWLPRWSAHLGLGLGIPLFVYAPPLPYLLAAALHTAGLPLDLALKGVLVLALIIMAYGGYRLAGDFLGPWPGIVCAAAILYTPVGLRELFIQGNVAQLLAWSFIPWTLWAVLRLFWRPSWLGVLWLALAMVGVILSHNAVALLVAGAAAAEALVLAVCTRRWRSLLLAAAGGALALLLGAWFWPAALFDTGFIQVNAIAASDYHARFLDLRELLAWSPPLDQRAVNPYYPLALGAAQVALALGGVAAFVVLAVWTWRRRPAGQSGAPGGAVAPLTAADRRCLGGAAVYFAGLALFGAFMALPWSARLWEILPHMDVLEFPFRWHGLTGMALGWLAGLAVFCVGCWSQRAAAAAGAAAAALLLVAAIVNLYPDRLPVGAWAWTPPAVVQYEVKTGQVGTTSLGEFTPMWVHTPLFATSPFVAHLPADGKPDRFAQPRPAGLEARLVDAATEQHRYSITAAAPATATLNLLFFPGWQAAANGAVLPIAPEPETGRLQVGLPAGAYELAVDYVGSPVRRAGEWVAAAAWLLLVFLLALLGWRRLAHRTAGTRAAAPAEQAPAAFVGAWTVLGLVGVLAAGVIVLHDLAPGWFRINSPPDRVLPAQAALAADFGGRIALLGVDPPAAVAHPRDAVQTTVYLQAREPLRENYGLFAHLDRPDGVTAAAVNVQHPADIPARGWPPGLYVRAPLKLEIPSGALPIRYDLRVGVTDPQGEWLPLADGSVQGATVGRVWVEEETPDPPLAGPRADFGADVHLLGVRLDPAARSVRLDWRADKTPPGPATIFVHFLDSRGRLLGQADGAPYNNLYPLDAWRPGQVIRDVRPLPPGVEPAQVTAVAVGVYDPASGVRWPARDAQGRALPDDALAVPVQ